MDLDIEQMLHTCKVMTLAVAWQEGAWSSPVYFLYLNKAFYFFSGPDSRHIRGAIENKGRAGASIFADAHSFIEIRGLQMEGIIEPLGKSKEALGAAVAYLKRFSISHEKGNALSFIERQYRARLYKFLPHRLVYMDNRVAMGFKKELEM